MKTWHDKLTDRLSKAFSMLNSPEEVCAFLDDVATISEVKAMAQRLEVARLLNEGMKYPEIAAATGASTATISRVKKCLEYGAGGYTLVLHDKIPSSNPTIQEA